MMNSKKLSFIIPAYNEEEGIQATIDAVVQFSPQDFDFEIIVVDHGSRDNTCSIVSDSPAVLLSRSGGTIASLRNYGVQHATGDILIFIDADVLLTSNWMRRFKRISMTLFSGERVLTGSWVRVPATENWIEKNWFLPLQKGSNNHINSGHMIISRELFDEINGFDERLETAEDYDISMRAIKSDIKIVDDVELEVIHEGFPKNLKDFFLREYWHGKGDVYDVPAMLRSKVAMFSLIFLLLHIMFLFVWVSTDSAVYPVLAACPILLFVGLISIVKYRGQLGKTILINTFLYYVYFWARTFSLVTLFSGSTTVKRER